jgi:hypothetical protein
VELQNRKPETRNVWGGCACVRPSIIGMLFSLCCSVALLSICSPCSSNIPIPSYQFFICTCLLQSSCHLPAASHSSHILSSGPCDSPVNLILTAVLQLMSISRVTVQIFVLPRTYMTIIVKLIKTISTC